MYQSHKAIIFLCVGAASFLPLSPILANDSSVIVVRCSEYRKPDFEKTYPQYANRGHYGGFDVYINLSKKAGWWEAVRASISEENPASLKVEPDRYELTVDNIKDRSGLIYYERVILDRHKGTVFHYSKATNVNPYDSIPPEIYKQGGMCIKLEQKF